MLLTRLLRLFLLPSVLGLQLARLEFVRHHSRWHPAMAALSTGETVLESGLEVSAEEAATIRKAFDLMRDEGVDPSKDVWRNRGLDGPTSTFRRRSAAPTMAEPPKGEIKLVFERVADAEAKLGALIGELVHTKGLSQAEIEEAFRSALTAAFQPEVVAPPNEKISSSELRPPATASDAQLVFREVYAGSMTTSSTQQFISALMNDRATAFSFRYDRIYAVGFAALCEAFLPATCISPADAQATRSALCFSLGLDERQLLADAEALAQRAGRVSRDEFLTSGDMKELSARESFKYTYVFGVGLVTLMRLTGEELTNKGEFGTWYKPPAGDDGPIDRWCAQLGLDKYAKRIAQDTIAPLTIDRVGTFAHPGLVRKTVEKKG